MSTPFPNFRLSNRMPAKPNRPICIVLGVGADEDSDNTYPSNHHGPLERLATFIFLQSNGISQSSHHNRRLTKYRIYMRRMTTGVVMARKMASTTMVTYPSEDGLTKLGVTPGGGLMAGLRSDAMVIDD